MKFVRESIDSAEYAVATALSRQLAENKRVLWLVSGGSNIQIEARIIRALQQDFPGGMSNLSILPMDERFGAFGHANSNMAQLKNTLSSQCAAHWHDILSDNVSLELTTSRYNDLAEKLLKKFDYVVGLFGLGADGHTAGILPHMVPITEKDFTAFSYEADDFTRLTLTPKALQLCDEAFVFVYGPAKKAAIQNLAENKLTLNEMPAKLLWDISALTVYNDYIDGDTV